MNNVVELRKNQPFKVGELVRIGEALSPFEIVGLGLCTPAESEFCGFKGKLMNASEFVQLRVPNHEHGLFHVHVNFLTRV